MGMTAWRRADAIKHGLDDGATHPTMPFTPVRVRRRPITVRSALSVFVAADLAALLVIALGMAWLVSHSATAGAVRDARDLTVAEGRAAVGPLLTEGVLQGDPVALAALDQTVRTRVLSTRIVRVKVWSADGTVLYSDEPRLIGQHFGLGAAELRALTSAHPAASSSNLGESENIYERQFAKLVQVYDGVPAGDGHKVLFEAYLRSSSVSADSHRALLSLLPAMLAGLFVLFLAQVPLAWTMARRLEAGQAAEQRLLHRALNAAGVERRHIAADLHDGPVQFLAGTALSLTAAAEQAVKGGMIGVGAAVSAAAAELRQSIRSLRALIVAIAPPRLHDEGLAAALEDLVSPLRTRGITTTLAIPEELDLPREVEALAYRTAQEAIRNIGRHAPGATHVAISVSRRNDDIHLEVADDGPGFSPTTLATRRSDGHVGLQLLGQLADEAGGHLDVWSDGQSGTRLSLELPMR